MADFYSKIKRMHGASVAKDLPSAKSDLLYLPTPSLNWAIGGGLAYGKVFCTYGPEQSGKTLIAILAIASMHATDPDAWAVWYDAEFSFNKEYAGRLGVDLNRLIVVSSNQPEHIFDAFTKDVVSLIQEGMKVRIMVVDSVKSVRGPREADTDSVTDHVIGDMSGLLNKAFRKLVPVLRQYGVLAILVQQVNEEMDQMKQMQGFKWRVPSGQALKHYSDYMVLVEKVENKASRLFDETHEVLNKMPVQVGHKIRCKVTKNRMGVPSLAAEFQLKYGVGVINIPQEIAELAVNFGVVEHAKGSTLYKFGNDKAVGFAKFVELVGSKPELQRQLMAALNDHRDNVIFAKAPLASRGTDEISPEIDLSDEDL